MEKRIMLFCLISGEYIIGEEVDNNEGLFQVTNPLRLMPTEKGTMPIPFCPFSEDKVFTLNPDHILHISKPHPRLLQVYKAQFGGIAIPDTGIIVP